MLIQLEHRAQGEHADTAPFLRLPHLSHNSSGSSHNTHQTHSITGGLRRHSGTPRSEVTIKAFCLMTMVGIPAVWEFISKGILAEVNKRRVPQEHV